MTNYIACHYRKKAKPLVIALSIFCSCFTSLAAQQKIIGVVSGIDNTPLYGATISDARTNAAVATDVNGYFSIEAEAGDVLHIIFVGYMSKEIKVENENVLKI